MAIITSFFYFAEFDCLGHWDGPDDQKYLALLDKQSLKDGKPQYRCAVSLDFLKDFAKVTLTSSSFSALQTRFYHRSG